MNCRVDWHGRVNNRWRVRVELARPALGLTVALVDENDRQLGPAVVSSAAVGPTFFDLRGPCVLPPGTVVRCTVDVDGGPALVLEQQVDRRRGLHAFLHADALLPVSSDARPSVLDKRSVGRLTRVFPWLSPTPPEPCCDDDLLQMLKDEFDVDPDDVDDALVDQLRGRT